MLGVNFLKLCDGLRFVAKFGDTACKGRVLLKDDGVWLCPYAVYTTLDKILVTSRLHECGVHDFALDPAAAFRRNDYWDWQYNDIVDLPNGQSARIAFRGDDVVVLALESGECSAPYLCSGLFAVGARLRIPVMEEKVGASTKVRVSKEEIASWKGVLPSDLEIVD